MEPAFSGAYLLFFYVVSDFSYLEKRWLTSFTLVRSRGRTYIEVSFIYFFFFSLSPFFLFFNRYKTAKKEREREEDSVRRDVKRVDVMMRKEKYA